MQDQLLAKTRGGNVEIAWNTWSTRCSATTAASRAAPCQHDRRQSPGPVDCRGVFIAIGHDPNTGIFKGQLDMDDGYIVVTRAAGQRDRDQRAGCVRRRRRGRLDLPPGRYLGRLRLHGGTRRGEIPRRRSSGRSLTRRRRESPGGRRRTGLGNAAGQSRSMQAEFLEQSGRGRRERLECAGGRRSAVPPPRIPARDGNSGSVGPGTGWEPAHLVMRDEDGGWSAPCRSTENRLMGRVRLRLRLGRCLSARGLRTTRSSSPACPSRRPPDRASWCVKMRQAARLILTR